MYNCIYVYMYYTIYTHSDPPNWTNLLLSICFVALHDWHPLSSILRRMANKPPSGSWFLGLSRRNGIETIGAWHLRLVVGDPPK